jgi:hypothetical protein
MQSWWLVMAMAFLTVGAVAEEDTSTGGGKKPETAATAETGAQGSTTCKSGGDVRTLTILKGDGYACQLKYTKAGTDTFPAQAKNDAAYCDGKLQAIKDKLVAAGFQCD